MVETVVNDPPSSAVDVNVAALEPDANHKGTQDTEQAVQADQQTDAVASNNAPDNEANGHKQTEQVDPVEWASRMWFVKVPKPQEDATLLALEQEHDSLKAQMNLLSESFKIKKVCSKVKCWNIHGIKDTTIQSSYNPDGKGCD